MDTHVYMLIYIYIYILRTLTRHYRTSMFFEIWVLWGDARFFALFASGCLVWLLLGWILAPAGSVFVPPGWILAAPGLHFESFVSLGGEPEAPAAHQSEMFEKMQKIKRLVSSTGRFFGHTLTPLPPKVEPASVLLRSFVSFFRERFSQRSEAGF